MYLYVSQITYDHTLSNYKNFLRLLYGCFHVMEHVMELLLLYLCKGRHYNYYLRKIDQEMKIFLRNRQGSSSVTRDWH